MPVTLTNRLTNRQSIFSLPAGAVFNFANHQPGDYIFNNDSANACSVQLNVNTFAVAAGSKWEFVVHPELLADGRNPIAAWLTGQQIYPLGPQAAGPPPLPFSPTVDLNFGANQYYGVLGAPSNFLTVTGGPGTGVDSAGNWGSFPANTARIMPGTGLWVEEARTNVLLQSAALTAAWQSSGSTRVAGQVAPDGSTNGSLVSDTTANVEHFIFSNGTSFTPAAAGTIYTVSMLCKAGTAGFAGLSLSSGGLVDGFFATVNLVTGAIAQSGHYGTGTLTAASALLYPNGWIRLQVTGSIGTVEPAFCIISNVPDGATAPNVAYAGTGTGFFAFWPQLELGGFATTPIPTTTAAVTRALDVVTLNNPPTFGPQSSVYIAGTYESLVQTNPSMGGLSPTPLAFGDSFYFIPTTWTFHSPVIPTVVPIVNTLYKTAAAVDQTAGAIRGTSQGAAAVNNTFTPSAIVFSSVAIGIDPWSHTLPMDGAVQRFALYPTTALSGAQLQQITT